MGVEVMPVPTALVTGAPEWVPPVAIALKSEGFDILSAGEGTPLTELLGRVDVVARLAPYLAPHAVVVLVGEEPLRRLLEIAALARPNGHHRTWQSYLDEDPELGFADWRDEVLCLTSCRN